MSRGNTLTRAASIHLRVHHAIGSNGLRRITSSAMWRRATSSYPSAVEVRCEQTQPCTFRHYCHCLSMRGRMRGLHSGRAMIRQSCWGGCHSVRSTISIRLALCCWRYSIRFPSRRCDGSRIADYLMPRPLKSVWNQFCSFGPAVLFAVNVIRMLMR